MHINGERERKKERKRKKEREIEIEIKNERKYTSAPASPEKPRAVGMKVMRLQEFDGSYVLWVAGI